MPTDPASTALTRRRVLKGTAGAATALVGLPAFSGVAAAHFPLELDIDIQPENADNYLDLDVHKTVSVAVKRTEFLNGGGERETFDPAEEASRYRFGSKNALERGDGARPVGDGERTTIGGGHGTETDALVLEFPVDDTGLDGGEEAAWLYWERDESGNHGYAGVDTVNVYGSSDVNRGLLRSLLRALRGSNRGPPRE